MTEAEAAKKAILLTCGLQKQANPAAAAAAVPIIVSAAGGKGGGGGGIASTLLSGLGQTIKGGAQVAYDTAGKIFPILLGVTLLTAPATAMGAAWLHSRATSPEEMDSDEIQKRVLAQKLEANISNLRRRQIMQGQAAGRVPGQPGVDREVRL